MRYAFFLGCSAPVRGRHYELSTRKVAESLGIELVDVQDFCCCGFPIKSVTWDTHLLLAARNLCLAEERGLDLCCICNSCTSVLTEINRELKHDHELRERVNGRLRKIGHEFRGTVEVKHFVRILYQDVGTERISGQVTRNLSQLRLAPHYGCHILKPSSNYDGFDDPENPRVLDELIAAAGAQPVEYGRKKQCCGGAVLAVDEDLALTLARTKLEDLADSPAEALCLTCTFCCVMYDDNQMKINKKFETEYSLPVLYYPQLLGLALGYPEAELGLNMNRIKTRGLLARLGADGG